MQSRTFWMTALALSAALVATNAAEARRAYTVARAPQTALECDAFAQDFARRKGAEGELLLGSGLGALGGFGIGSIFAAAGVGAAIGAPVGLLIGAGVRAQREFQIYAAAYQDCRSGIVR